MRVCSTYLFLVAESLFSAREQIACLHQFRSGIAELMQIKDWDDY
jgi:hypothetical protein